jgi:hypothetical protein
VYAVWLKSFPKAKHEKFYRIFKKNNRAVAEDEIGRRLHAVEGGAEQKVRVFHEEEPAQNLVDECVVNGGDAEVREEAGSEG